MHNEDIEVCGQAMQRNENNDIDERTGQGTSADAPRGGVFDEERGSPSPEGGEAPDDTAGADNDTLKKLLAEARAESDKRGKELAELKDLMQRRQADFENYKKRVIKSQEEDRKYAVKDLALDIITVHDDLLRAIEAAESVKSGESLEQSHRSFVDGVMLISRMMMETLGKYHIEEIDHLNMAFDPQYNEAVEIVASDEVKEDTITKIYRKGFKLDNLVLRCARVRVSRPPAREQKEPAGEGRTQ